MTPRPAQVKDLLIEHLREAIASGRLPPGQRLTELKLAKGLGVSRTPVREALMTLNHIGLVAQHKSGRGFEVRGYSLKEARDILYVRSILEGAAAERLAQGTPEDTIAKLHELVRWEREQLEQGTYPTLKAEGHLFHATIVESAGSRELQFLFNNVLDKLRMIITSGIPDNESMWESHRDHLGIVEAIATGDPGLARQLVINHCDLAMRTLMRDPVRLAERARPLKLVLDDVRERFDETLSG